MLNLNQNIKSGLDNPKKKRVCILLNYACLLLSSQFSIVSPLNSVGDDCPPPSVLPAPSPPPTVINFDWSLGQVIFRHLFTRAIEKNL